MSTSARGTAAERAANERIQDLNGPDNAEKLSVMNALTVLHDLRGMTEAGKKQSIE
jgi:hypothetical protein